MPLTEQERERIAPFGQGTARAWTEQEFTALRTSMTAMLAEARKMGLSDWVLKPATERRAAGPTARHILQRRHARAAAFVQADPFTEPAWEILLHLFAVQEDGRIATVREAISAVQGSAVASHLAHLERRGLVLRVPVSGGDTVQLRDDAVAAMRDWLEASWPG